MLKYKYIVSACILSIGLLTQSSNLFTSFICSPEKSDLIIKWKILDFIDSERIYGVFFKYTVLIK